MAYVRIWLHCVWKTKKGIPYFTSENKDKIFNHILENTRNKGVYIDFLNGDKEHIHCIISLNQEQTLAKVIQLIKGESSFWINKNKMVSGRFEWADEYFAVSVSESQINKVRNYIKNQEEHHRNKTWDQEFDEFMSNYKFEQIKG